MSDERFVARWLVRMRRALVRAYHQVPGRPLLGPLHRLDGWVRQRLARTVVAERGGLTWELDLSQLIDQTIYYNGVFEPDSVAAYTRLLSPGMVALDVGGNIGCHALQMARLVGEHGRVVAFEPTDWAFGKLRRNLALNPALGNVQVERLALGDRELGEREYAFQAQWDRAGREADLERGRVEFTTLDAYCERAGIARVGFIKLDVDGYESKVLRGAKGILTRDHPPLLVEMGAWWQTQAGDSLEILVSLIEQAGYAFHREDGSPLEDVRGVVVALPERATVNVLCLCSDVTAGDGEPGA